jgi:hypothetical protein
VASAGIYPPVNYNKHYSRLFFYLLEIPLARRGVYFPQRTSGAFTTFFGEHDHIDRLLPPISPSDRFFVDLGAGDGMDMNNVYPLCARGWKGLAVEADARQFTRLAVNYAQFPSVRLTRTKVTPANVVGLLESAACPREFAVLDLDLDSYDYFVLEKILSHYHPSLVLTEINPLIPPPVKFSVKFGEDVAWRGDWFHGMSLSQLDELARAAGYDIVRLAGVSAFLLPRELNPHPTRSLEDLYNEGIAQAPAPPKELEGLSELEPDEIVDRLDRFFADRAGEYICEL